MAATEDVFAAEDDSSDGPLPRGAALKAMDRANAPGCPVMVLWSLSDMVKLSNTLMFVYGRWMQS